MKFPQKYFVSAFLAFILLAGLVTPVYALTIINVSPGVITNNVDNQITITGTDFLADSVVLLDGAALSTHFQNNGTLIAIVPAGLPFKASGYTVEVRNSGDPGETVEWSEKLTIINSPPPPPTATPSGFGRPQLVITSYKANVLWVQTGKEFNLNIDFDNAGTFNAINAQAVFTSADVVPTKTGGVLVLGSVAAGGHTDVEQTFLAVDSVYGKSVVVIDAVLTYYDEEGTAYTDKFTLNIPAISGTSSDVYPTSTPTGVNSAQLVITSYAATVDPLQPGEQFQLGLTVQNMGNTSAKHVTMIVGGGSAGESGETPQPGGVSGSGGEFTNFAPLNSSNIQSLGDIPAGGALQVLQDLIVNVSTEPGAYPMKISFSYVNNKGEVINDDQVITLLVYSLPNVDVSFYRPLDSFFAGEPGALPLQIVNLGKHSTVLGNMRIEATGGTLDPDSTLVGSLEAGGYFTFDATLFPDAAGPLDLMITIEYTDDFNQPRTLTRTLSVTVEESMIDPSMDPSQEGTDLVPIMEEESLLRKIWRVVLGLLGLDSAPPSTEIPGGESVPAEQMIPIPSGGGKGG